MYFRRKKTRDQVSRELYERIKPFVDEDIKRQHKTDVTMQILLELVKSIKWIVLIPFPILWGWIKAHILKNGE
jgi:hypothetical protein